MWETLATHFNMQKFVLGDTVADTARGVGRICVMVSDDCKTMLIVGETRAVVLFIRKPIPATPTQPMTYTQANEYDISFQEAIVKDNIVSHMEVDLNEPNSIDELERFLWSGMRDLRP